MSLLKPPSPMQLEGNGRMAALVKILLGETQNLAGRVIRAHPQVPAAWGGYLQPK